METHEHVIVGAGSAGLATGALLQRAGLEPLLLEAGLEPGAAWRARYDRLRLHTPRLLSGLPGRRIPRRLGRWVARDGVLEYLREYAEGERLDVRTGVRVDRIERDGDAWRLETAAGPIQARDVIVATGYNGRPFVPDWPGRESFTGELTHSADYRNPLPYVGRDVLVVGIGNSGAEIATDVAEGGAVRTRVSVRTSPQIVRRATAGIPAQLIGIAIKRLPPAWVDPISKTQRRLSIPTSRRRACRARRSASARRSSPPASRRCSTSGSSMRSAAAASRSLRPSSRSTARTSSLPTARASTPTP